MLLSRFVGWFICLFAGLVKTCRMKFHYIFGMGSIGFGTFNSKLDFMTTSLVTWRVSCGHFTARHQILCRARFALSECFLDFPYLHFHVYFVCSNTGGTEQEVIVTFFLVTPWILPLYILLLLLLLLHYICNYFLISPCSLFSVKRSCFQTLSNCNVHAAKYAKRTYL